MVSLNVSQTARMKLPISNAPYVGKDVFVGSLPRWRFDPKRISNPQRRSRQLFSSGVVNAPTSLVFFIKQVPTLIGSLTMVVKAAVVLRLMNTKREER